MKFATILIAIPTSLAIFDSSQAVSTHPDANKNRSGYSPNTRKSNTIATFCVIKSTQPVDSKKKKNFLNDKGLFERKTKRLFRKYDNIILIRTDTVLARTGCKPNSPIRILNNVKSKAVFTPPTKRKRTF